MSQQNKAIVEKVNESFAKGDTEGFLSQCEDNFQWTMLGDRSVKGKEAVREWMSSMGDNPEPPKFSVDNLIAEGDTVVANGEMTMKDKDGAVGSYGYCDVYRFTGGRITELTSYVVKTNSENVTREASA